MRWRNGIESSQIAERKSERRKPLAAIWYRVLGLMRREAILSTRGTGQSDHTWLSTVIGLKHSICQQLVIWNQTTASEGKRQRNDLLKSGPDSSTQQIAENCCCTKKTLTFWSWLALLYCKWYYKDQLRIWALDWRLRQNKSSLKNTALMWYI